MSNDHHAIKVQLMGLRDGSQEVHARGQIEKAAGPSAAGIAGTPVLDVPGRDARVGQSGCQGVESLKRGIARVPRGKAVHVASPVHQDDDGMWRLRSRQAKFAEL
jgi:hypothetical protein